MVFCTNISSNTFLTAPNLTRPRPNSELLTPTYDIAPTRGHLAPSMSIANLHSSASTGKRYPSTYQERVDWNSQSGLASKECLYPSNQSIYSAVHVNPVRNLSSHSPYHCECVRCATSYLTSESGGASGNTLTVPLSHPEHSTLKVIGTCKMNDGKRVGRFRNAETNTESATTKNGDASFSLRVSPPEKQEYPALTKFFHNKFMKGHGVESDTVGTAKNNVAFKAAQMPGIAIEVENSSVSSVVSSGDRDDSASPCCMNECCSASSTTSDSSDPSANCKTGSKCKYSEIPEFKLANRRNYETADRSIRANGNTKKVKDVDDILLSNLNTSGSSMHRKLENKNIEVDGTDGHMIMSMLNLDLSCIKDDDNSSDNSKQSKCWKSPEEVRLGYGRVAALAKHFSHLGDGGLIRICGRGGCRGRTRTGLWSGAFKSVPDMTRTCLRKDGNWDCLVPVRPNSCSHVCGVGLGAVSYSADRLSLGCGSDDFDVRDQYKSCEELVSRDDGAEFKIAGSGDKEFETVARQLEDQEMTRGHEDASQSSYDGSRENRQVLTEVKSVGNQLRCCNSSANGCLQQHEVGAAKHRAFILLTSKDTPVKHSKSVESFMSAVPYVGSYQDLPLFSSERPRSEDNILKVGPSKGNVRSWDKERRLCAETESHLRPCLKSESVVFPNQMKFCRLVDRRPKSEDNILLSASAQDKFLVGCGGNEVRSNLEPRLASAGSASKEPERAGRGLPVLTRCKQQINHVNAVVFWCSYCFSRFPFVCLHDAPYVEH